MGNFSAQSWYKQIKTWMDKYAEEIEKKIIYLRWGGGRVEIQWQTAEC